MENLGTEVGQKMRCAVKAKLLELGTGGSSGYIDDELPDYVMIMVANKRSKEQMTEDLNLFLGSNTDIFVNWLHQVLQKLQEVTLPSTLMQKPKRKSNEAIDIPNKKEKKEKKKDKKIKRFQKETSPENILHLTPIRSQDLNLPVPSITDVFADQLIQKAKRSLEIERTVKSKDEKLDQNPNIFIKPNDDFDIPTITEIAENAVEEVVRRKELSELEELQKKINLAKRQLRAMTSEESEDEDFLNIKADGEEFEEGEHLEEEDKIRKFTGRNPSPIHHRDGNRKNQDTSTGQTISIKSQRIPITYNESKLTAAEKSIRLKRSILERLGSRPNTKDNNNIISLSVHRKVEKEVFVPSFRRKELEKEIQNDSAKLREKEKEIENRKLFERNKSIIVKPKITSRVSVKQRIGSRVIVPPPKPEFDDDKVEVPVNSIVKIKPRPLIPLSKQANKNLLLKAVAEAQKSTAFITPKRDIKKSISPLAKHDKSKHRIFRDLLKSSDTQSKTIVIEVQANSAIDILKTTTCNDINEDEYTPELITNQSDSENENMLYVTKLVNSDENLNIDENFNMSSCDKLKHKINKKNPQFVVTLDGVYKKLNNNLEQGEKKINKNKIKKPIAEFENNTNAPKSERPKIITKMLKKINAKDNINITTKKNLLKCNPIERKLHITKNELTEFKSNRLSKADLSPSRQRKSSPINFNIDKKEHEKDKKAITKDIKLLDFKPKDKDNTLVIKKSDSCKKYENLPALLSTVNLPVDISIKTKSKERCKYFPNCRQADACEFIHPNSVCKSFPNCLYASKCLYLHPKCKYDLTCTRLDCNYSHTPTSSSAPPLASHVVPVQNYISITANQLPPMCKFYPSCSNSLCTFYHPKLCRFGKNCLNKVECNFYHYELPTKDKLKWVSASNI